MAKSGVETVRVAFRWFQLQPAPGAYDLRVSDAAVAAAVATRDARSSPVIEQTPGWAATRPGRPRRRRRATRRPRRRSRPCSSPATARRARSGASIPSCRSCRSARGRCSTSRTDSGFWSEAPYAPSYVATLRAVAAGIRSRRPGRDDRARRPHEPQLARAAPALQVRRARPVRRRRPAPVHAPGGGRAEARALRAPGHGQARRRRASRCGSPS